MKDHKPVAKLVAITTTKKSRVPGNCQGMINIVTEDEEHLKDFQEYIPRAMPTAPGGQASI